MCSCCDYLANQQNNALRGFGFMSSLLGSIGGNPYRFAVPDSEGWYEYCGCPAPDDALCIFERRQETIQSPIPQITRWIGYSRDFQPEFDVGNLRWKYTGIAREERGL